MQVWPFWRKTINVTATLATEVTIWDGQVGCFGGYASTGAFAGPGRPTGSLPRATAEYNGNV